MTHRPKVLFLCTGNSCRGQMAEGFVDEHAGLAPDLVVTVCDHAAEVCPVFPGARRTIHHAFADPAHATGSEEEILAEFRRVRDEIAEWVDGLPDLLRAPA